LRDLRGPPFRSSRQFSIGRSFLGHAEAGRASFPWRADGESLLQRSLVPGALMNSRFPRRRVFLSVGR